MKQYIAYFRSWPRKSPSRVEITTQETEAARFVSYNNGQGQGRIIAEYTDKETKLRGHRPELAKAIDHAIRSEATLVICHLGRLARNVPVTRMLLESQVDFVCLDNQEINRRSIHIIANVAEEETRKVSDRSKSALAAAKARGVKLGSADPRLWKGREHLRGTKKAIAAAAQEEEGCDPEYLRLPHAGNSGAKRTRRDVARDRGVAESAGPDHDGRQTVHPDRRVAADRPLPREGMARQHQEAKRGEQGQTRIVRIAS